MSSVSDDPLSRDLVHIKLSSGKNASQGLFLNIGLLVSCSEATSLFPTDKLQ